MKKRVLSMALALILALSLCVPALAAEEEPTADAAPTQRLKEVNLQYYTVFISGGRDHEETLTFSYENGGTLPSSFNSVRFGKDFAVTYDDAGRVLTGHDLVYTYDEEGRVVEKNCSDGFEVYTYRYDEDGRLQGYTYEVSGEVAEEGEYEYHVSKSSGKILGADVRVTKYSNGQPAEPFSRSAELDDNGRVIHYGNSIEEFCDYHRYAPQLRIGYCDPKYVEMNSLDPSYCYLVLDVLDAAGTSIDYSDFYGGWVPPIDMTYDDAGYLIHMESSNGYTADLTYEPVA